MKTALEHDALFQSITTWLSSLATSYGSTTGTLNPGETSEESCAPRVTFAERGGIQARTIKLDFPKFDGTEPYDWLLKAEQFFSYGQTLDEQKVHVRKYSPTVNKWAYYLFKPINI